MDFEPEYEYLIRGRVLLGRRLLFTGRYSKYRALPENEYTRRIRKGLYLKNKYGK